MNDVFQHAEDLPTYREQSAADREEAELLLEAEAFLESRLYRTLLIQAKDDEDVAIEALIDAKTDEDAEQARKVIHRCRNFAAWANDILRMVSQSQQDVDPPY